MLVQACPHSEMVWYEVLQIGSFKRLLFGRYSDLNCIINSQGSKSREHSIYLVPAVCMLEFADCSNNSHMWRDKHIIMFNVHVVVSTRGHIVHCKILMISRKAHTCKCFTIPGEKNGVIARNCAWKTAINAPNYAVFKTLYLLDCTI